MSDCQREMSLREVAMQYGGQHCAAKSYLHLKRLIVKLNKCVWWEFAQKRKITKSLKKEIDWIEEVK